MDEAFTGWHEFRLSVDMQESTQLATSVSLLNRTTIPWGSNLIELEIFREGAKFGEP